MIKRILTFSPCCPGLYSAYCHPCAIHDMAEEYEPGSGMINLVSTLLLLSCCFFFSHHRPCHCNDNETNGAPMQWIIIIIIIKMPSPPSVSNSLSSSAVSRTSFIQNHAFSPPKIHTAIVIAIVIIIVPQLLGLIIPIFPLVKLRGEAREKSQIQVDHVTQIIFTASVLLYQITLNIIEQPAADPSSKNMIFLE